MPLISLIEDNYSFVTGLGIPAASLSQTGSMKIGKHTYAEIKNEEYKIVYLTPEKLVKSNTFMKIMEELYEQGKIGRFVIDEVHCVSHWG